MVTSETQEIKKQETLVRFSIISYKTRLSVKPRFEYICIIVYPLQSNSNHQKIQIIIFRLI